MAYKRTRNYDDDDEHDGGYSRHNKVAISSQGNGDSHQCRIRTTCPKQHGECSFRNDQSNNNIGHRSIQERDYYIRGPNGYIRNPSRVLQESKTGWYAIHVHNVTSECDEVIKVIQRHVMPIKFYPYNIHFVENAMIFVIDDFKTARTLQNLNSKIHYTENRKLTIRVRSYWPLRDTIPVTSEEKEKMAQEIVNRYNPINKCMDLSQFHSCQMFTENKLFLPLNRPVVLMAALKLAADFVKNDLYGLSLENNLIYTGNGLKWIRRLFPELKVLNLSDNKLTDLEELASLSGFNIAELDLLRNPVDNSKENECYNWKVQEMFPMLKKFGKTQFQSRYCMNTESTLKMPVNRECSYATPEGLGSNEPNPVPAFAQLFITQYFDQYDDIVSRKKIGVMYNDDSKFSLSSTKLLKDSRGNLLNYSQEGRNLLHSTSTNNQNRFLHKGPANIEQFLEKLPKTKHDLGSFQIDVPIANSALTQIIVNGLFAENFNENNSRHEFKSFTRTFCLTRNENDWRIISDMLFVTLPSNEMIIESVKRLNAVKQLNKKNVNMHVPNIMFMEDTVLVSPSAPSTLLSSTSTNCSSTNLSPNKTYSIQEHVFMIKHFSKETGMNEEWAKKCLEENDWDYSSASNIFLQLKPTIPSIAFIHDVYHDTNV